MNKHERPIGLGVMLMSDKAAFKGFASLSIKAQQDFIDGAADIKSNDDMKTYISSLKTKENVE